MSFDNPDAIKRADAAREPVAPAALDERQQEAMRQMCAMANSDDPRAKIQGRLLLACAPILLEMQASASRDGLPLTVERLIGAVDGCACLYASVLTIPPVGGDILDRLHRRFVETLQGSAARAGIEVGFNNG